MCAIGRGRWRWGHHALSDFDKVNKPSAEEPSIIVPSKIQLAPELRQELQ
jgi:hypothetical protein